MISWGITSGSHDGSLCVFDNSELVFATDSERFSRIKNDKEIPINLIEYAKKQYGNPQKIYFYENLNIKAERKVFSGQNLKYEVNKPIIFDYFDDIEYTDHHLSHASYGFYTSPFEECLILVIDAIGEWETLTLWESKVDKTEYDLKKIKKWKYPKSLGLMYSACTQASGFKPNEEEYIMMGASSIKPENKKVTEMIRDLWEKEFNFHKGVELNCEINDIPSSAQIVYEEIFKDIIKEVIDHKKNNGNLVFCGGCALNVKANRFLKDFDNVYIPCNPGDGGSSVGCVLSRTRKKISPNPYLGYEIDGDYPIAEIIQNLNKSSMVGVAKGKAEFGPRALGNRSIFGDPRVHELKDILNTIKGREFFRPFGAMILKEDLKDWYHDIGVFSPYMNCVYTAKDITVQKYPSLIHFDKTTRLQIIDNDNLNLRNLLQQWKKETGCPFIVNTSLNVKGQPIANTKDDLKSFKNLIIL